MRQTTVLLALSSALLCSACATATSGAAGTSPEQRRPMHRGLRDPITAVDIAQINAASAYDAVVTLRAGFLHSWGVNSVMQPARSSRPVVFVDGHEMGTIFELRSIPASDVVEIRFLSSSEAAFRNGDGYLAGVIQVSTKR